MSDSLLHEVAGIKENMDQKKLSIWTLFMQLYFSVNMRNSSKSASEHFDIVFFSYLKPFDVHRLFSMNCYLENMTLKDNQFYQSS